jgi:hypothetical protein
MQNDEEIDLSEALKFLWTQKKVIAAFAALGLLLGSLYCGYTWSRAVVVSSTVLVPNDAFAIVPSFSQKMGPLFEKNFFEGTFKIEASDEPSPKLDKNGAPLKVAQINVTSENPAAAVEMVTKIKRAWELATLQVRGTVYGSESVWTFDRTQEVDLLLQTLVSEANFRLAAKEIAAQQSLAEAVVYESLKKQVSLNYADTLDLKQKSEGFKTLLKPLGLIKITIQSLDEISGQDIFKTLVVTLQKRTHALTLNPIMAMASASLNSHPAQARFSEVVKNPSVLLKITKQYNLMKHYQVNSLENAVGILSTRIGFALQNSGEEAPSTNIKSSFFKLEVSDKDPQKALELAHAVIAELRIWILEESGSFEPGLKKSKKVLLSGNLALDYLSEWISAPQTLQKLIQTLHLQKSFQRIFGFSDLLLIEKNLRSNIQLRPLDKETDDLGHWIFNVTLDDDQLAQSVSKTLLQQMSEVGWKDVTNVVQAPFKLEAWLAAPGVNVGTLSQIADPRLYNSQSALPSQMKLKWNQRGLVSENTNDNGQGHSEWGENTLDKTPPDSKILSLKARFATEQGAEEFLTAAKKHMKVENQILISPQNVFPYVPQKVHTSTSESQFKPLRILSEPMIIQSSPLKWELPEVKPELHSLAEVNKLQFEDLLEARAQSAATQKLNASRKMAPPVGTILGAFLGVLLALAKSALNKNKETSFGGMGSQELQNGTGAQRWQPGIYASTAQQMRQKMVVLKKRNSGYARAQVKKQSQTDEQNSIL